MELVHFNHLCLSFYTFFFNQRNFASLFSSIFLDSPIRGGLNSENVTTKASAHFLCFFKSFVSIAVISFFIMFAQTGSWLKWPAVFFFFFWSSFLYLAHADSYPLPSYSAHTHIHAHAYTHISHPSPVGPFLLLVSSQFSFLLKTVTAAVREGHTLERGRGGTSTSFYPPTGWMDGVSLFWLFIFHARNTWIVQVEKPKHGGHVLQGLVGSPGQAGLDFAGGSSGGWCNHQLTFTWTL